jgi:hypothetical protein
MPRIQLYLRIAVLGLAGLACGDGNGPSRTKPLDLSTIVASDNKSCGETPGGTLLCWGVPPSVQFCDDAWCWGDNSLGALGAGPAQLLVPTHLPDLDRFTVISLAAAHGCGLTTAGAGERCCAGLLRGCLDSLQGLPRTSDIGGRHADLAPLEPIPLVRIVPSGFLHGRSPRHGRRQGRPAPLWRINPEES